MSNKIKVSEIFYSIQGEGRYMGVPSIFLRTFGCNFTCSGFGMPEGEKSNERFLVNSLEYKSYKDLPLVKSGCDSYASWDVRFKDLSPVMHNEDIVKRINSLLPNGQWHKEHLVITGGEPLLGWQKSYKDLLHKMPDLHDLTFETNGTQNIDYDLGRYLLSWADWRGGPNAITFSVSPKLSESGESWENAIKPDCIMEYTEFGHVYLKFVISREKTLEEVDHAVNEYQKNGFFGDIYLMPVGGTEDVYSLNSRRVAELALKRGWRYSDRLQVPLFKNAWGT